MGSNQHGSAGGSNSGAVANIGKTLVFGTKTVLPNYNSRNMWSLLLLGTEAKKQSRVDKTSFTGDWAALVCYPADNHLEDLVNTCLLGIVKSKYLQND